jgi:rhodanese-related sulfurtransferase
MTACDFKTISAHDAHALLAVGAAVLVDVREADEFKAEHIAFALSLPLSRLEDALAQLQIPPGTKIIFQCQKGKRGEQACRAPCQQDGRVLYNMDGGLDAWKAAGFATIATGSAAPRLSIFRQVQIIIGFAVALAVLIGFSGQNWGFWLAGILGAALGTAGLTGWCGLALLLMRMPWNNR